MASDSTVIDPLWPTRSTDPSRPQTKKVGEKLQNRPGQAGKRGGMQRRATIPLKRMEAWCESYSRPEILAQLLRQRPKSNHRLIAGKAKAEHLIGAWVEDSVAVGIHEPLSAAEGPDPFPATGIPVANHWKVSGQSELERRAGRAKYVHWDSRAVRRQAEAIDDPRAEIGRAHV